MTRKFFIKFVVGLLLFGTLLGVLSITFRGELPLDVRLVGVYGEKGDFITSSPSPNQEGIFRYEITNHDSVSYIVELTPTLYSGYADSWETYKFQDLKNSQPGLGGSVIHLMLPPNSVTLVDFMVESRQYTLDPDPPFEMYVTLTDCTDLKVCPWG